MTVVAQRPKSPARGVSGDRLPALAALLAGVAVLALGALSKLILVDPLLDGLTVPDTTAREVGGTLFLIFGAAALLAAAGALSFVHMLNRPTHELAESIALSGMAEVPAQVPSAGSSALRLVARRYNELVEAVATTNQMLKESAALERQRAEQVEDFSDLVLAGVPSGIIAVDAAGVVVRANTAARRILHLGDQALEGRTLDDLLGAAHPVARAAREPTTREEVSLAEGAEARVLGVSSGEVRAPGKAAVGSVVIFADLTELRRLEQQLEMRERLASLGQVAAGLAHELRNPLGALRGFVELLDRRLDDPARARPLLEKIVREADALAGVAGDFLAFARPSPPRRQPLAVAALLSEAAEAGRASLGDAAPRVEVAVAPEDLEVSADAAQVRRALVNFVINAGQSTGPSGRVVIGAHVRDGVARLYVEDDGPGVSPELEGKLPTPFFTTKPSGTGLGLAVAHQIAQAHGGDLLCERPVDGGARFVLALPMHASEEALDDGQT